MERLSDAQRNGHQVLVVVRGPMAGNHWAESRTQTATSTHPTPRSTSGQAGPRPERATRPGNAPCQARPALPGAAPARSPTAPYVREWSNGVARYSSDCLPNVLVLGRTKCQRSGWGSPASIVASRNAARSGPTSSGANTAVSPGGAVRKTWPASLNTMTSRRLPPISRHRTR
jgi:hypothetical protein